MFKGWSRNDSIMFFALLVACLALVFFVHQWLDSYLISGALIVATIILLRFLYRHTTVPEGTKDNALPEEEGEVKATTDIDLSSIYTPSTFHGRRQEIRQIADEIAQGTRVLTLLGMGGIGKSVLACKAAERVKDRFDAVWGFSFKTDTTLQNFLNQIGKRLLGKDAIEKLSGDELKSEVLNNLSNGRRLLILDNFETVLHAIDNKDQAAIALKDFLSRIGKSTVLMFTSRRHPVGLDDEKTIKVVSPERQTAIDILCSALGDRQQEYSDEQMDSIAAKLADHPLSCRLIGGFLSKSPLDAQKAVDQVLDLLPQARVETEEQNQRSLDESLDLSLRNLPPDELRMLRACSVFKGEFVAEAGEFLAEFKEDDQLQTEYANKLLFSLHQRSLLEHGPVARYPAVKTYAFHSLIRQTLQRKLEPEAKAQQLQLLGAYADMLSDYIAQKQGIVPTDWLVSVQQMLPDLVRGARSLGKEGGVALLNLGILYQQTGQYIEALALYFKSLDILKAASDQRNTAAVLHQIGMIHQNRGDLDAALEQYQQSIKIKREIHDKAGVGMALHQIGMIHRARGDYTAALEQYQQSLEIKKELGDKAGIAQTLHNIGVVNQVRGDLAAALEQYQQAQEIFDELGAKKEQAAVISQIGIVYMDQGSLTESLKQHELSLSIRKEIGDLPGVAIDLHQIGSVHEEQGDIPQAIELMQQALEIFERIGAKPEIKIARRNLDRLRGKV
ncbi:MAG: tetratricopeptide repeat protein [Candidatus Alcyoniella australis]|nr:tetratricopeptide repeat protein [Candidatus Alcyoniella australis]